MTPTPNIQPPITQTPAQPVVQTYTFEQYQAGMQPPVTTTVPPPAQVAQVKPPVSATVAPPLETGGPLPGAEVDEVLTPWKVLFWPIEEPVLPEYVPNTPSAPTPAPIVEPQATPTPAV